MPIQTLPGLLALAQLAVGGATLASGQAPRTGTDVLDRMHHKYAGKWYETLTFTQKTMRRGRDGNMTEQTWYESLQWRPGGGAWLRIDTGNLGDGNGSLSTADSTWIVRAGKLTSTNGSGNPFIPMIENVYLQPVPATAKQLESLHFDMTRVLDGKWQGQPVWVVGAMSLNDSTSPQFWIDRKRLVVVRMILVLAPNRPPFDIHLDGYVKTGGGWLATKITMLSLGVPQQTEEYSGWKTRITLDPKLFDPATWSTAKHWARP